MREEANAAAPKDRDGKPAFKLSLNDFIIRALALALQRVPAANAAWAGDCILRFKHSDIGVAVALDGGLVAPIIRNAETKSLTAISAEMKDLAARARDKKLKPADYQGGSSAISNLGMYGVREFSAIINPPQATILAVGAARRQAVEKADGGIAFASMLTATLSCDHRVVDGALGAELLAAIKALMETPVTCWCEWRWRWLRQAGRVADRALAAGLGQGLDRLHRPQSPAANRDAFFAANADLHAVAVSAPVEPVNDALFTVCPNWKSFLASASVTTTSMRPLRRNAASSSPIRPTC